MISPETTMREFGISETHTLLESAAKGIRKAADNPDEEAVHKMRVGIRRFQQSVRLFGQFFRPKGLRQVKSDLKSVMTPAGELRNCDIAIRLVGPKSSASRVLATRRQEAQNALTTVLHELGSEDLVARWKGELERSGSPKKREKKLWRGKKPVQVNLRRSMPELVDDYFEAGDKAMELGRAWDELHGFRLLTKRFRYTLELLRPAYGRSLEPKIEQLRTLQTLLGDMNDAVVTSGILADIPRTERIRARLAANAERLTQELRKHWTDQFAAPARRLGWKRYLVQYACRTRPAPAPVTPQENVSEEAPKPAEPVVY